MILKDHITTIIWDWNGTLLNDVDVCIRCMNSLLQERKLPLLDHRRYMEIFTFPVKDYYLSAGFNFSDEPFEIPAHQFIDLYRQAVMDAPLHKEALEVLSILDQRGYGQAILSAMEKDFLIQTMQDKDILPFFRGIFGIDNHLGAGKSLAAKALMHELRCESSTTVIIGDTLHDAEVARELGIACILVSHGHQSWQRLEKTGYRVIPTLSELQEIL